MIKKKVTGRRLLDNVYKCSVRFNTNQQLAYNNGFEWEKGVGEH